MALSKSSMAAKIKTAMSAVPPPASNSPADLAAYNAALLEAMCQGIILEITQNGATSTVTTAPAGTWPGTIA